MKKKNFTVILGCMADGTKLPPVCIFKLKNIPKERFPDGVIIRANEKGWNNEIEMLWWIENVWIKRSSLIDPRSLLILDSFRGHLVDSVKHQLYIKNTNIAVIPGGLTPKLQPLDVGVNKCFKIKVNLFIVIFSFYKYASIIFINYYRSAHYITSGCQEQFMKSHHQIVLKNHHIHDLLNG
jgi:hypothetical protein